MTTPFRIGTGYDVHRLEPGRPLVIGGVTIEWEMGLAGHSDADVLLHGICDAMLGAVGLGDIGRHFADSDPEYENYDSRRFIRQARVLLADSGYQVANVDATIIAEQPKMAPHIPAMVANIAKDTGIQENRVNIKATTTEGLGFCGRGEGIAAMASVLVSAIGQP